MSMMSLFPSWSSVDEFYSEDETRRRSPELDFGVMWVYDERRRFPNWRVSFIDDTQEVYAIELTMNGRVILLAETISRVQAEAALSGWADGEHKTLNWVADRVKQWWPRSRSEPKIGLVFEEVTSQLTSSNDGRVLVRIDPDRRREMVWIIDVDGREVWRTKNRLIGDAFIAGWDAREETP